MAESSSSSSLSAAAAAALQQKLWHGRIPVVFSLHTADVTTLHAPRPFYAMLPRMGYLISQTRTVIEYFRDAAPPIAGLPGQSIWFEHNSRPLKWHLPCGVLYDLSQPHQQQLQSPLPWRITVHFSGFPADEVLPCENEQVVEFHFMHALKQSMFLRTGSTKLIMGMPEAQQSQIWTSILQNDPASFSMATRDLQLASAGTMRFIPLRVYVDNDPVVIQLPVSPTLATLGEALALLLPDLFSSPSATAKHETITHGIAIPLSVPLLALYEAFAYPDGFLHLAIVLLA